MPSTMYMATVAARTRIGRVESESRKSFAVPWNEPWIELGTPSSAIFARIASSASESETPAGRLNDTVEATNWPWWFTESGAFEYSYFENAESGTRAPAWVMTKMS